MQHTVILQSSPDLKQWQSRMSGEQQIDCWPPPLVSDKINELRQIVRAKKTVFKRNYHNGRCLRGISEMQDGYEINLLSSQPAKAK